MNAREEVDPGFPPSFSARVDARHGVANITLSGDLDMATVHFLDRQIDAVDGASTAIVLDLRDLTFLDCSGLHAFIVARDRAMSAGRRFILIGAAPHTRRLFDITGTGFMLDDADAASVLGRFSGTDNAPDRPDGRTGD
jgi:anti-sigma B factor antagonist